MSHEKLKEVLADNAILLGTINKVAWEMEADAENVPFLSSELLSMLDDCSPFINMISDSDKRSYVFMVNYLDLAKEIITENLDNIIKFARLEVFDIIAANGLRSATVNEVENGVEGLIQRFIYPASEEVFNKLCIIQWALTGRSYFIRQAGVKLEYNSDGKVTTSTFEILKNHGVDIAKAIVFIADYTGFDKAIAIIKKAKKRGYRYATSAPDEIVDDISVKQLIRNIDQIFPRNSQVKEYRKARALVYKTNKENARLTPLEISELRRIYKQYAIEYRAEKEQEKKLETNEELRMKCETILHSRDSGLIDKKHFAFVIITTLKNQRYTKCSPKQMRFIDEAYDIITKANVATVITEDMIDQAMANNNKCISNQVENNTNNIEAEQEINNNIGTVTMGNGSIELSLPDIGDIADPFSNVDLGLAPWSSSPIEDADEIEPIAPIEEEDTESYGGYGLFGEMDIPMLGE